MDLLIIECTPGTNMSADSADMPRGLPLFYSYPTGARARRIAAIRAPALFIQSFHEIG